MMDYQAGLGPWAQEGTLAKMELSDLLDLQGQLVSLVQLEAEGCLDLMAQEVRRDQLEAEVCWVPKVPRATLEELENLVLLDCKV